MEYENENETIRQVLCKYLRLNGKEVKIDKAKSLLKNYIPEQTLEHIHFVPELIAHLKFKNCPRNDFIMLLSCVFVILRNDELKAFIDDYEHLIMTTDIEDDENIQQLYKNILSCIDDSIGYSDVVNLKEDFRHIVDSERTLSNIRTLSQLMEIMEDRDAISDNDFSALEFLLNKLNENEHVIASRRLINTYSKLLETPYGCKICRCQNKFDPEPILNNNNNNESIEKRDEKPKVPNDELQLVINYLSKNLGPDWKKLARALNVREGKIKALMDENPKDVEEQIIQMLLFWRNSNEDTSIKKLLVALRGPMCQKMLLAKEIEQNRHLNFY